MKELKSKGILWDVYKDGVFYQKQAGNCLKVIRMFQWKEYWKTAKHVGYDRCYDGQSYSNFQIPEEVDGMKVVSVQGVGPQMSNVSFPDTIKTFGNKLEYINNVVFPSSVTDSNYEDLLRCTDIVIPCSVQTVGAIRECNNIELPNTVKTIGSLISSP